VADRSEDFAWIKERVERYHARRLRCPLPQAYRPGGQTEFKDVCRRFATSLPSMEGVTGRALHNYEPPWSRRPFNRAAMFALGIIRDLYFLETNTVTVSRTAIDAGWQLLRWEGLLPVVECDAESESGASKIDQLLISAGLPGVRNKEALQAGHFDWGRVLDILAPLYNTWGACGAKVKEPQDPSQTQQPRHIPRKHCCLVPEKRALGILKEKIVPV